MNEKVRQVCYLQESVTRCRVNKIKKEKICTQLRLGLRSQRLAYDWNDLN